MRKWGDWGADDPVVANRSPPTRIAAWWEDNANSTVQGLSTGRFGPKTLGSARTLWVEFPFDVIGKSRHWGEKVGRRTGTA